VAKRYGNENSPPSTSSLRCSTIAAFRSRCLFLEAVPAAKDATDSPTAEWFTRSGGELWSVLERIRMKRFLKREGIGLPGSSVSRVPLL
jgi:hypothetical protein